MPADSGPGLDISGNFHLPDFQFQNFTFFNTDYTWFRRKRCPNLLARLAILLALGHRSLGYVEPCKPTLLSAETSVCTVMTTIWVRYMHLGLKSIGCQAGFNPFCTGNYSRKLGHGCGCPGSSATVILTKWTRWVDGNTDIESHQAPNSILCLKFT